MTTSPFSHTDEFEYEGHDLDAMEEATNYYGWIIGHLSAYLGSHLLEVGAGTGNFTESLFNRYGDAIHTYTALEPEPHLFQKLIEKEQLKSYSNLSFLQGYLENNLADLNNRNLDSALYINVLEHIQNDRNEIKLAYELIEAGGHILTFTPAMPALYSPMDRALGHYRRYRLEEMVQKMSNAGFLIREAYYFDMLGSLLWWLKYKFFRQKKLNKNQVFLFDRIAVPLLSRIEPSKKLPFGKNIIVIGQKPST